MTPCSLPVRFSSILTPSLSPSSPSRSLSPYLSPSLCAHVRPQLVWCVCAFSEVMVEETICEETVNPPHEKRLRPDDFELLAVLGQGGYGKVITGLLVLPSFQYYASSNGACAHHVIVSKLMEAILACLPSSIHRMTGLGGNFVWTFKIEFGVLRQNAYWTELGFRGNHKLGETPEFKKVPGI